VTLAVEARRAWRALLDSHKPQTREERLRLVGLLSPEHRAAVLAERAAAERRRSEGYYAEIRVYA